MMADVAGVDWLMEDGDWRMEMYVVGLLRYRVRLSRWRCLLDQRTPLD
jgi:hypothetical protein